MTTVSVSGSAAEEGDALTFSIALSSPPTSTLDIEYVVTSGTAEAGEDFGASSGSVRFSPGETLETVAVPVNRDTLDEPDESVILRVTPTRGASLANQSGVLEAVGWILDDGDATGSPLSLYVSDPFVREGDAPGRAATFDLQLSRPAPTSLDIPWRTVPGSADAPDDYTASAGTAFIGRGDDRAQITVPLVGDDRLEANERLDLALDLPGVIAESNGSHATIVDDEARYPTVLADGDAARERDGSSITFAIALSAPPISTVDVEYRVIGGTATAGQDFSPTGGSVRFSPGETLETVTVAVRGDDLSEPDESIILRVFQPNGLSLGDRAILEAVGWILDDGDAIGSPLAMHVSDPFVREGDSGTRTAPFEVELSRPAPRDLSIPWSTGAPSGADTPDYAETSETLAIGRGDTAASIGLDVFGDTIFDGHTPIDLFFDLPAEITGLSGGLGTLVADEPDGPVVIVDGDTVVERAGFMVFTIGLSSPRFSTTDVEYRVKGGTATAGSDFTALSGSVRFSPGETLETVAVAIAGDDLAEPDESVILEVTNARGAALPGGAPTLEAVGWILDDGDTVGSPRAVHVSDIRVLEGDSGPHPAPFLLEFSRPAADPTSVSVRTIDGTATAGEDYVAPAGPITVGRQDTTALGRIAILGDTFGAPFDQPVETFRAFFDSPGALGGGVSAIATIVGSDPPARVGTDGDDTINGTADSDAIFGRGGNDLLGGVGDRDRLAGEAGDDTLIGGPGNDTLDGGPGRDRAVFAGEAPVVVDLAAGTASGAATGEDRLIAIEDAIVGGGADAVAGTGGANRLDGGRGADTLEGRDGPDRLVGGDGNDSLAAGPGDDTIEGGSGADTVDGGPGRDRALYLASAAGVAVDLAGGTGRGGAAAGDRLSGIEDVTGSVHGDTLGGDAGGNLLLGGTGGDRVNGRSGDDTLSGEGGDDTLSGGGGDDALVGAAGNDRIDGGPGSDDLDGGDGDDRLAGRGEDDTLSGGGGADRAAGGRGDDDVGGGAGADTLLGGPGEDALEGEAGDDVIVGRDDDDRVLGGDGDDALRGGSGDDRLAGAAGEDRLVGGAGGDTLEGGADGDVLAGDQDGDTLDGGPGADRANGGGGDDVLDGGPGGDRLFGAVGADAVSGDGGRDTVSGGGGDDTLAGGEGRDLLSGEAGLDVFVFVRGDETDRVRDFEDGRDRLDVSALGIARFRDIDSIAERRGDTVVEIMPAGGGDAVTIRLLGIEAASLSAADFIFA